MNTTTGKSNKTFVIDTNVFLSDAGALYAFEDNDIVIPMIVLEEIDNKKDRMDAVGSNARQFCRSLDELRQLGSLRDGVPIGRSGGKLRVLSSEEFSGSLPDELNDQLPDNMIISVAVGIRDKEEKDVKLVTKDINMRIKCNVVGLVCEDYLRYRVAADTEDVYTGIKTMDLPERITNAFKNDARSYQLSDDELLTLCTDVHPNEFIVDKTTNIVARLDRDQPDTLFRVNGENKKAWGIEPRNIEQRLALKLLFDDRIKLVSLVGAAGTGKTLIAVAAALEMIIEGKQYRKLIITRPIQPVGCDLGYLPGTKEDKMDPWVQPIYDNIEYLMGKRDNDKAMFDMWISKGMIEIEAITYIRGRSLANAFIIIDEAQNLSVHELKTIVTRAGEGTKIILTGDIEQVDNNLVDPLSNGLTYAVEKFKDQAIAGHITLTKGERSELATLAAKIL